MERRTLSSIVSLSTAYLCRVHALSNTRSLKYLCHASSPEIFSFRIECLPIHLLVQPSPVSIHTWRIILKQVSKPSYTVLSGLLVATPISASRWRETNVLLFRVPSEQKSGSVRHCAGSDACEDLSQPTGNSRELPSPHFCREGGRNLRLTQLTKDHTRSLEQG